MTRTSVCSKDCLLEGLEPNKLPPSDLYDNPREFLNPRYGLFAICRGRLACEWGAGLEHTCLEILGPGEIWEGWSCAAGECRAWPLEEVQGHWIKRTDWLELLRIPTIEERFWEYMRKKSQRQHEWQLVLARGSVRARVAWQLLDLAERFGELDEATEEIFVAISLTRTQQAQLCGASRARVGEALDEFTDKRWLVCGSRGFWVRDKAALQQQSREAF